MRKSYILVISEDSSCWVHDNHKCLRVDGVLTMTGMCLIQEVKKSSTEIRKNADLENYNDMKEGAYFHHLTGGWILFQPHLTHILC